MKRTSVNIFVLAALAGSMFVVFAGYSDIASRSMDPDCINHGDVNLDGSISAADAQLAFFIVLGQYSPTDEEECAADCSGNGSVTAGDAQAIFFVVLGLGDCTDPLVSPTATPADTPVPTDTPTPVFVSVGNMMTVSAGTFTQGSPVDEPCRNNEAETQFTHTLTRNLAVMETEVTRQMWADLLAVQNTLPVDPSYIPHSPSMSHPVQQNSWYESVLFANLLSLQNGYAQCYYTDSGFTNPVTSLNYTTGPFYCDFDADGYRLPTEGEWEYFCRAGTTTVFSCSETNYTSANCVFSCTPGTHPTLEQYCVYCANQGGTTQLVGEKLANPWNLKDVHGNVWEWCWDWYGEYPAGSVTDYTGLTIGSERVCRGGHWTLYAVSCRSSARDSADPYYHYAHVGFRLVRLSA